MKEKLKINLVVNFKNIIDYILVMFIFLLSIQKGGFYKSDNILFALVVEIFGLIVIIYNIFKKLKSSKKFEIDIVGTLLLFLPVAYMLPIFFENYASLDDSIVETFRYFNVYLIYKIVRFSENKNMYKNLIIYIAIFLGVLGVDGIGCRFLQNILQSFNSNYLNIDLNRMSSTIQYANVLAIILSIASVIIFDNVIEELKKENNYKESSWKKYNWKIALNYECLFFVLSCLILTLSRTVIVITILYYIFKLIYDKEDIRSIANILICLLIELTIFSIVAFKYMYINKVAIYFIELSFLVINLTLSTIKIKFTKNIRIKNEENKKIQENKINRKSDKLNKLVGYIKTKKIQNKFQKGFQSKLQNRYTIFFCFAFVVYLIIASFVSAPLKITEKSKDKIVRRVYLNDNREVDKSILEFLVKQNEEDSRYTIDIYTMSSNNEKNLAKTFSYYNTISGKFEYEFLNENIVFVELQIKCSKGSINLDEFKLNGKKILVNYAMFPNDIVFKIKDVIHGADSVTSRFMYFKDALKIWRSSFKNIVFGVGGEGFKNLYETVQTESYSSTEVHNSFVQILIESGVMGLVVIVTVCLTYIIKAKNNVYKYAFLMLMLHSIFDLDFSYTIILVIFAILLAVNNIDEKNSKNSKINLNNNKFGILAVFENVLSVIFTIFCIYMLVNINMAYFMKIDSSDDNSLTKEAMIVSKLEKRVMYDSSDKNYRKNLAEEYDKYLKMLVERINENEKEKENEDNTLLIDEVKNVIQNIESNATKMQGNDRYNKSVLIDVSNIYFNNIMYLSKLKYEKEEEGYEYYFEKIKQNLEFIEENYRFSNSAKELLKDTYNDYYNELDSKDLNFECYDDMKNYIADKLNLL